MTYTLQGYHLSQIITALLRNAMNYSRYISLYIPGVLQTETICIDLLVNTSCSEVNECCSCL